MELMTKQGYKQTEVGLIPEDWNINILGNLAFVTKLAGFEYTLHFNSYKDEGDIIVVRGTNITHNKMDLSDVKTIPTTTSKKLLRSKLFKNDLVFAYVGTIGPIFLIEENNRYHLGPNTAKISVERELNSKYLYHYFTSTFIANEIFETTSVGAQPSLSMSKIRSFKIVTPTLTEQKAIATALSDVDALITSLEQTITKKKAIKQGAMQQLLTPPHKGGKRLPGFEGEWVEKTLGEIFDFKTATSKKQFFDLSGDLIVMDMGSVSAEGEILKSKRANCDFDILKRDDLVMPKDDIGGGNIIGKVAYIDKDNFYVLSDHVFRLRPLDDKIDSLYFSYLINSSVVNETILKVVSGSAQLGLGLNIIKHLTVYYNSDNQQQKAIAQILSDMDAEITQLETKKEKYQAIKQGMMQELLTGKTRLI